MGKAKFTDNSKKVLRQMERNVESAMNALGVEGDGLIKAEMPTIRGTGFKYGHMRNAQTFEVDVANQEVSWGNTIVDPPYPLFQHEGTTRGIPPNQWINRGILNNRDRLAQVATAQLKKGF